MAVQGSDSLLQLARVQLDRLQQGDLDTFFADEAAYAGACIAYAESATEGQADDVVVHELIHVTSAISAELERLMGETSGRLAALNSRRRASGAYLQGAIDGPDAMRRLA